MVVDDVSDLLAVIKMMLENQGYRVHGFTNPKEALVHVKDGCTDCTVVLSDVRMPFMSGIELVNHVKNLRPEMKIILMTAYNIEKEESQIVFPVDSFLNKPFTSPELIKAVERACSN